MKWYVRLADGKAYDEDWEPVESGGPRSAAEKFVEGFEASNHRYPVANGEDTLLVDVRGEDGTVVQYEVSGEIVRSYSARPVEDEKS